MSDEKLNEDKTFLDDTNGKRHKAVKRPTKLGTLTAIKSTGKGNSQLVGNTGWNSVHFDANPRQGNGVNNIDRRCGKSESLATRNKKRKNSPTQTNHRGKN